MFGFLWLNGCGCRSPTSASLRGTYPVKQFASGNQMDRLSAGKARRIGGETADADDVHRVCAMVVDQAPHFADGCDTDLTALPLFALDQFATPTFAYDQVDAAVLPAQTGLKHVVALSA